MERKKRDHYIRSDTWVYIESKRVDEETCIFTPRSKYSRSGRDTGT